MAQRETADESVLQKQECHQQDGRRNSNSSLMWLVCTLLPLLLSLKPCSNPLRQTCQRLPTKTCLHRKDTLAKDPNPSCSVQPTLERETNTTNALTQCKLCQNKIGTERKEAESTKAIARPWFLEPWRTAKLLQWPDLHWMFLLHTSCWRSVTSDATMEIVWVGHGLAF